MLSVFQNPFIFVCSTNQPFVTHLQRSHSGLVGFGSPSPAALGETPPEQAAAAPRKDSFPGTPAPTCRVTNTSCTHRLAWKAYVSLMDS